MLANNFKFLLRQSSKNLKWNFISNRFYYVNNRSFRLIEKTETDDTKFYKLTKYNFATDPHAKFVEKIKIYFPKKIKEQEQKTAETIKISSACIEVIYNKLNRENI